MCIGSEAVPNLKTKPQWTNIQPTKTYESPFRNIVLVRNNLFDTNFVEFRSENDQSIHIREALNQWLIYSTSLQQEEEEVFIIVKCF